MALSNTGSMALRLDEVQPPNTAATQSLLISFSAFSANTVGSDAPSSPTTWICLPITPPAALISSTASVMASRTVTSEIAIVPDSEFSEPTLMVEPEVSTHDSAFAASVFGRLASAARQQQGWPRRRRFPSLAPTFSTRSVVVVALTAFPYVSSAHRMMSVDWSAEFVTPRGCRIGTLERLCFCEMTVCDEQINL